MSASKKIQNFIKKQNSLGTLRFITCGSVDDGKSTLLGRMLYEAQLLFDDQVENLKKDSERIGTQGKEIDFALLVDGLSAEREQGITIDVAYRFFSTEKRKFIVADSPGHEQYTRNMVTAASNADSAIILIDARNGLMPQTKRHTFIANLVGIKTLIVAVNKMDLKNYSQKVFNSIVDKFKKDILSCTSFDEVYFVPVSALKGDNIISKSSKMRWYKENTLMQILENLHIDNSLTNDFVFPVQYVNRPNSNFRGYSGTICSGNVQINDSLMISGTKEKALVTEIYVGDINVSESSSGDSITLVLDKDVDISRGDVLTSEDFKINKSRAYLSKLIWFDNDKCYPNRSFILKTAHKTVNCELLKIKNKIDVNTFGREVAGYLNMNDIAEVELLLDQESTITPYAINKTLGNFILIDRKTNLTVAAGIIEHDLRRSTNVQWQKTEINREARLAILGQKSCVIWFTGLSGAGKSTIANLVEKKLSFENKLTYMLDGDNLRHGLNKDLGFKKEDRIENLRRVGEVAKILYDSGVIVVASFISPYIKDRQRIRDLFPSDDFIEVYVEASIENLKLRDPKGLYAKAEQNEIPNFTGISSDYQPPNKPELHINTDQKSAEESSEEVLKYIFKNVFRK
tara:strand:- start:910 stop:2796 length:1887 start_codon:yes stop_codon:yes gene_type:complete